MPHYRKMGSISLRRLAGVNMIITCIVLMLLQILINASFESTTGQTTLLACWNDSVNDWSAFMQ